MKMIYVFNEFYITEERGTIDRKEEYPYYWEYRSKEGVLIDKDSYRNDLFERNNLI